MTRPDISIIIPVYNVEDYLAACLDSVLCQTHTNIEIIIVDDKGTDSSMDIARKYAAQDSRIKIVTHTQNSGLSAARNTGLQAASVPFIMFLDSDDYYAPAMCAKMLEAVTSSDADMAICATRIIYQADEQMRASDDGYYKLKFRGLETLCDEVLRQTDVSAWNKIYRASIIKEHAVSFPQGLRYEDAFFFNAYACWAKTIYFLPEELYCYRRRPGSIMNQTFQGSSGHSIDHLKIGIKLFEYFQQYNLLELRRNYLMDFLLNYVRLSLNFEPSAEGKKEILHLLTTFIAAHQQWFNHPGVSFQNKYLSLQLLLKEQAGHKCLFCIQKHQITLFGINIWRVNYMPDWVRYFLFGIRIAKRRSRADNSKKIYPFQVDDSALLSVLKSLPGFTYIPNSGNLGDMLIAAATLLFFRKYKLAYRTYDATPAKYIVYGGGGIWTGDYKYLWQSWLPLFQQAEKVVILPSSFYNCPDLVQELDERFVVFCREKQSYEYLKSFSTKATILLDHDMALRIDEHFWDTKISRCAASFKHCLRKGAKRAQKELAAPVSFLLRKDCERQQTIDKGVDLSSFIYADAQTSEQDILFIAQTMMRLVNKASIVVTDRLHISIASLLLGKETYLLDNSYKKLSNVYAHSLAQRPQAFMINALPPHFQQKVSLR